VLSFAIDSKLTTNNKNNANQGNKMRDEMDDEKSNQKIAKPVKNKEQQWAIWDSTRLNDFEFRQDDIVIDTYSKSGTTWTQQLVGQIVFQGDPEVFGQTVSPWIEARFLPKEEMYDMAAEQTHRRFLKSHSPLSAIPFHDHLKYIFVARDARDVVWSLYHHHNIMSPDIYEIVNNMPGLIGPPLAPLSCDIKSYYHHFLDHDSVPGFAPDIGFWSHIQEWWDIRNLPNVHLVHYANLKADFEGQARQIAAFLDIDVAEDLWPKIIENCSLSHMKELASKSEMLEVMFEGGGGNFVNKGTNGRWKDVLSEAEIAKCDEVAAKHLTPECAHWLKTGEQESA
jgi:aryl sulfotransferase